MHFEASFLTKKPQAGTRVFDLNMKAKRAHSSRTKTIISVAGVLLFATLAYWLLGFCKADLLFRGQELSLFLFDRYFFFDLISKPGGLLEYAGSFLSQFFYYPLWGALIMLGVLLLIQWSVYRLLSLSRDYFLLSFLPSCFLLLFVVQLDYNIYLFKIQDVFYSQMLGFLFALLPLAGYKKFALQPKIQHYGLMLFHLVIGYPLAGFYALLGLLFLLIRLLVIPELAKKAKLAYFISGFVMLLLIPQCYAPFYSNINQDLLYGYGLPVYDFFGSGSMNLPLLLAWLSLAFCFLLSSKPFKELKTPAFMGVVALLLLSMVSVWLFSNKDPNLKTQLAIENAISQDDWDKVLRLAKANKEDPDRILVMYRNLALWKNKSLCQSMFLYPQGDAPLQTTKKFVNQTRIAAQTLTLYYGMVNYCYRWNMENAVSFGFSVHNLKYMLRASILNREEALAQKYAHVLSKTLFYKRWARDELYYLKNPRKMRENPVYADILSLRVFNNSFAADIEVMESAVHEHFMSLNPNSLPLMEWKMSSILTTRAVHLFWAAFFKYLDSNWALPLHVQEAALMIGHVEERDMPKVLQHFEPAVVNRYQEFTRAMASFEHLAQADQARLLKKGYGNTTWYYFYYTPRFRTN